MNSQPSKTSVRLLAPVGDGVKGAVVVLDDRRAQRLIQMGYAQAAPSLVVVKKKRKAED